MLYNLYFHDDLDGVASGAVLLDFLKKNGDDLVSFTPLEYNTKHDAGWERYDFKTPFVLVDFQYHPKADWWIDHHASAFAKQEWQSLYHDDDRHHWDPKAPSACGLVARFLEREHEYKMTEAVRELAKIVDIDDSAGYLTLESALELDSPSKKIQLLLGDTESKKDHKAYLAFREFLIKNLVTLGMEKIALLPEYQARISALRDQRLRADALLQKQVQLKGDVIFIDKGAELSHASRWAPYQAFPEAPYSVQILDKGGEYKVGIGSNKWSKIKPTVNLGDIAKSYGGGGHKGVGALFVKSRQEAMRIADEIIIKLNDE